MRHLLITAALLFMTACAHQPACPECAEKVKAGEAYKAAIQAKKDCPECAEKIKAGEAYKAAMEAKKAPCSKAPAVAAPCSCPKK